MKSLAPLRAAVLISGGTDSTFALYKATQKYKFVEAITFSFSDKSTCCSLSDIDDAVYYSKKLNVKHKIIDVSKQFKREVIEKTESIYLSGKTPNPCAICNKKVKIEQFIKENCPQKYDVVVTGHYASVTNYNNRYCIERAKDSLKDQSYFLGRLEEKYLKYLDFPCGKHTKTEIRDTLKKLGFEIHKKGESQDLCFANSSEYTEFKKRLSIPGDIVHLKTKLVIGKHNGIINYTVGQRKGLGISWEEPLYVAKIDPVKNIIYAAEQSYLFSDTVIISDLNWICASPSNSVKGEVKIRSLSPLKPAEFVLTGKDSGKIILEEKVFAPTPGQLAVFYKNNRLVFSGWIN